MRIYDLEKSFDDFVKRDDVQIELIGENGGWIATVSTRKWSNEYQRYVCEDVGSCTAPSFLGAYDFIAQRIHHLSKRHAPPATEQEGRAAVHERMGNCANASGG